MVIKIPEYDKVFEDRVYGIDGTRDIGGEVILVREILLLGRFTGPSEEDVVNYLQKKTNEVEGDALPFLPEGVKWFRGKSKLERAIIALPEKLRRNIRSGDEACLNFVRRNTSAPARKEGENKYVNIRYGTIPTRLIAANEAEGNIDSSDWYFKAFLHDTLTEIGLGGIYNIIIMLHDGALPEKKDIDVLVKHGAFSSRIFDVNRSYDSDEMKGIIDSIYMGLAGKEEIERLKDFSHDLLEKLTLRPVLALHELAKQQSETGLQGLS